MKEVEHLRRLKAMKNAADSALRLFFRDFAEKCEHRRKELYDGKDEWHKCCHKDYFMAEYTDMTPCDPERCPLV